MKPSISPTTTPSTGCAGLSLPFERRTDRQADRLGRHLVSICDVDDSLLEADLFMPFEAGLNISVIDAEVQNFNWLVDMGLIVPGDAASEAVEHAAFHHLSSLVYQVEDGESLALVTNFITFLFFFDDMVDSSDSEIGTNIELIASVGEMMMMGVLGNRAFEGSCDDLAVTPRLRWKIGALQNALADLTRRMLKITGDQTALEFYTEAMSEYFEGNIIEARMRCSVETCDLPRYTDLRLAVSAVHPCLEIGAITRGLRVSDAVRNSDDFRELRRACNLSVSYINDLFSYRKEALAGETSNLVHVLRSALDLETQDALDRAAVVANKVVFEFVDGRDSRSWSEDERGYIELMEAWMRGNMEWYLAVNERYMGASSTDRAIPRYGSEPISANA